MASATYLRYIPPGFILIFLGIFACNTNCQNVPDITFLSRININDYKYLCVIGRNFTDHAVTFITPLSIPHYLQTASEIRTPEGALVSEEINCEFENECSKTFNNNDWETVQSANHLLPVIHDVRFEKLYTHRTRDKQIPFEISEQDFYFPISLRTEEEPQILLCTDGNENIIQCYWISIKDSKIDNIAVIIKKCNQVNKLNFMLNDSECLLLKTTEAKSHLVWNLDWFHYILLRNESTLIFKDGFTDREYMKLENVKEILKNIYIKTSNGKRGEWKIHKNSYLRLKTFDSEVQLGSTFSSNNDDNFCMSMLVSICQGCTLEIRINNQTRERFIGNADIWRNIKVTSVSTQTNEFKIFVKGSRSEHSDIIAIDNIRLCHEHEIRILSINNKFKLTSISCKALSYPTWYSTLNYTSRSLNDVCPNATYIGKNCEIPCSAVLGQSADTEFCNKHFICKPTENYNEQNCVCAAGYRGYNCDETCTLHNFGYNCQKWCGKCKYNDTCLKSSGICSKGCESEYVPDMCIYKRYEPINLSGTADENGQIQLNWLHPKTNESVTKYNILTSLMKSDTPHTFLKIEENVNFPHRKENYSYKLQKPVLFSSTYTVEVCGNGIITHCANTTLATPPVKPILTAFFITVDDYYDNSKIINIPGIVPDTQSSISFMYITVCIQTSNGTNGNNSSTILEKINCSGISWIAAKIETDTNEVTFIVGEGNNSTNFYNNPPLEDYNNYNICVVVTNEYENKSAYNVYCEENYYDSFTNLIVGASVLGVLILGLIIFAIIVFVQCLQQRKQNPNGGIEEQNNAELSPLNRNVLTTEERPQPLATDL